jgi:23S rRNA pseudouridine2605 synthase
MRIQKYLSEQGIASRRKAEELIRRGLVSVNGKVVREMGVQIDPAKDKVGVLPYGEAELGSKSAIMVNKPRGVVSSRIRKEGKTIYDLLPQFSKLDIIGRLDKASDGLLLLSNDGVLARVVTGDHHGVEKEYEVTVREATNAGRLKSLEQGVGLEDGPTLPCRTEFIGPTKFRIILREGRKHQIRRMCEYLHLTVVSLKRLRIGPLLLGSLKHGEFRELTRDEILALKKTPRE